MIGLGGYFWDHGSIVMENFSMLKLINFLNIPAIKIKSTNFRLSTICFALGKIFSILGRSRSKQYQCTRGARGYYHAQRWYVHVAFAFP